MTVQGIEPLITITVLVKRSDAHFLMTLNTVDRQYQNNVRNEERLTLNLSSPTGGLA